MRKLTKSEYVVIKRIEYNDDLTRIYCFLGTATDEKYDLNNPFHIKHTVGWKFEPAIVKTHLLIKPLNELVTEFKMAFHFMSEDKIKEIKTLVYESGVREIINHIETNIDIQLLRCTNMDVYFQNL